jgi:hypothetical protein
MRSSSIQRKMHATSESDLEHETSDVCCQVCCASKTADEAIVLWREDEVVFAVCRECTGAHDIVMRPSSSGVQVLAKSRGGRPIPAKATPYEPAEARPLVATRRLRAVPLVAPMRVRAAS